MLEFSSHWPTLCKNSSTISPRIVVDGINSLINSVNPHNAKGRTENLLFVAGHIGTDIVNYGRPDEVAIGVLFVFE